MTKSKRRSPTPQPKVEVKHKQLRRNVKQKLKLGKYDDLPEIPRKVVVEDEFK